MRAIVTHFPAPIIGNNPYVASILCVIPTEVNGVVGVEFVE